VYALDASTGRRAWDVSLESGVLPPRNEAAIPLLANGELFVGSAVAPFIHAIDPANGRLLWERRVRGVVKGGIVYVDGAIYFGDLAGYLWALDARTGSVVGDKNMNAPFNVGSPIVDGDTLIVGSNGGSIIACPLASIRYSHDR
jgi:outer membrane protein assembly factor BamB